MIIGKVGKRRIPIQLIETDGHASDVNEPKQQNKAKAKFTIMSQQCSFTNDVC